MPGNDKLQATLERIDHATAKLTPEEALKLIDIEIADPNNADYRPRIEVRKGINLRAAGRTSEAAEFMEQCAARHDSVDSVHYFGGEYLLQLGLFARSMPYLSRCIEEASGNRWYEGSAYLLRAYCAAKTGSFDLARQDLARVKDDDPMSWINAIRSFVNGS